MKTLIDGLSVQARWHTRHGHRLADLLAALSQAGPFEITIGPARPLEPVALIGVQVLIVLTRAVPYLMAEVETIAAFVRRGGGLILMSNHADLPGRNPSNHARHDAVLAKALGATVTESWFRSAVPGLLSEVPVESTPHPILAGPAGEIRRLVCRNGTSVAGATLVPLARWPATCTEASSGRASNGDILAGAFGLDDGRVLLTGDSGMTGSWNTFFPGQGLFDRGDNAAFMVNAAWWAAGLES